MDGITSIDYTVELEHSVVIVEANSTAGGGAESRTSFNETFTANFASKGQRLPERDEGSSALMLSTSTMGFVTLGVMALVGCSFV